jgi:hypothetical protein
LIPGYVASRAAATTGGIRANDSEFARALWAFGTAVAVVPLFYLVLSLVSALGVDWVVGVVAAAVVEPELQFLVGYSMLIVIAYLLGSVSGAVYSGYHVNRFGTRPTPTSPWSKLATRLDNAIVHVMTADGAEILGITRYVGEADSADSSAQQDLILQSPRRINPETKLVEDLGKWLYIGESEIKQVEYYTGDLKGEKTSRTMALFGATAGTSFVALKRIRRWVTARVSKWGPVNQDNQQDAQHCVVSTRMVGRSASADGRRRLELRYRNRTKTPLQGHAVRVNFRDESGCHLWTSYGYKGRIGPFKNWSYDIRYLGPGGRTIGKYDVHPIKNPTVMFAREPRLRRTNRQCVTGTVRNLGACSVVYLEIEIKYFDGTGELLSTETGYVWNLSAGESVAFEIPYRGKHQEKVFAIKYRISRFWENE